MFYNDIKHFKKFSKSGMYFIKNQLYIFNQYTQQLGYQRNPTFVLSANWDLKSKLANRKAFKFNSAKANVKQNKLNKENSNGVEDLTFKFCNYSFKYLNCGKNLLMELLFLFLQIDI